MHMTLMSRTHACSKSVLVSRLQRHTFCCGASHNFTSCCTVEAMQAHHLKSLAMQWDKAIRVRHPGTLMLARLA